MKELTPEQREKLAALHEKSAKIGKKLSKEFLLLFFAMLLSGQIANILFVQSPDFGLVVFFAAMFMASVNLQFKIRDQIALLDAEHKKIVDGE